MRRLLTITAVAATGLSLGAWTRSAPDVAGFTDGMLVQMNVADLGRAVEFYQHTLGFELIERDVIPGWAKLRSPTTGVVFGLDEVEGPFGSAGLSLNLTVRDADALRAALEARGVEFSGPTVVIPGVVTLAEFTDPDGNRIKLAGPAGSSGDAP